MSARRTKAVLVTGGAGFLGAHVARALLRLGYRVVIYDMKQTLPQFVPTDSPLAVVKGDVQDWANLAHVIRSHDVTDVIHTAAFVGEAESMIEPLRTMRVNTQAVLELMELHKVMGLRRFIQISSRSAYGAYHTDEGPTSEDTSPRPVAIYGASKFASDMLVSLYRERCGLDVVSARVAWMYGPGEIHESFLARFVRAAMAGEAVRMIEGADYEVEFTYVKDIVRGLLLLLRADGLEHTIYNIGMGRQYRLSEVAATVRNCVPEWDFSIGPGWLSDEPPRASMSIARITRELGYVPRYTLADGVVELIRWEESCDYGPDVDP